MKTTFLLSDIVLMGLISSFTSLAVIVLTAVVNASIKRMEKKQDKSIEQMDGHMTNLLKTTEELGKKAGYTERKEEQIPIIEQKVKEAEELGKLKGKEELRIEIKKENGDNPSEVVVVENKDKEVIIKKNLDK